MRKRLAVLLLAFAVSLPALPQSSQDSSQQSSTAGDKSKDKGKKKSGDEAPKDATAKCKDGTYSYAKHHQGACSHHGGVAQWYK